jgi:hypothetical protein
MFQRHLPHMGGVAWVYTNTKVLFIPHLSVKSSLKIQNLAQTRDLWLTIGIFSAVYWTNRQLFVVFEVLFYFNSNACALHNIYSQGKQMEPQTREGFQSPKNYQKRCHKYKQLLSETLIIALITVIAENTAINTFYYALANSLTSPKNHRRLGTNFLSIL